MVPCHGTARVVFSADAFFAAKVSTPGCSIVLAASSTGWEAAAVFVTKPRGDQVAYAVPCHGTTTGFQGAYAGFTNVVAITARRTLVVTAFVCGVDNLFTVTGTLAT